MAMNGFNGTFENGPHSTVTGSAEIILKQQQYILTAIIIICLQAQN